MQVPCKRLRAFCLCTLSSQVFIPIMPLWVAIFFALLNCYIPGAGTFLSAFCVCCTCLHYHTDESSPRTRTFFANFFFGPLQFFGAVLFGLGYIWSVIWGFLFVAHARVPPVGLDCLHHAAPAAARRHHAADRQRVLARCVTVKS